MSDWETKNLGDLLDRPLAYGVLKPGPYEEGGIPLVRIQDHKDGEIKSNSLHKIPIALHHEFKRTELRDGDIIISVVGTIGRTAIIPKHLTGANVSRAFAVIGCSDEIDKHFLDQYLKSDISQSWFKEQCQGNAQQVLNLGTLREYPVPIPPLPEQKKIAEILSGIDRCIAQVKLRIQKQNLINESLLSGIEDLRGDEIARCEAIIGDIASKVGSGITPRGGSDTYESEGITFIRSQNVLKMRLSLDDAVKIPQHIHASMSGTRVQPNDVLLNITGASIGRAAVAPDGIGEANVNQHVCIIRTKETCDPLFLCGWLNSESGQIAINSSQAGGNRQGLNFEQIRAMSIPLPPIHLQKQISAALQASNSLIQLMQGKLDWLLNTKNALSSDLLSGRKRVSI